jgi:hypothetical protein
MKRWPMVLIASCTSSLAVVVLTSTTPTAPGFTVHDLHGRYSFVISGEATQGPVVGPLAAVGVIVADGQGNFPFATRTLTVGGQLVVQNDTATGTYTMNPDGTGTATFFAASGGGPQTFDFALTNRREFFAVSTTPGVVAHGPAHRQN